jgi:hypothetical protein
MQRGATPAAKALGRASGGASDLVVTDETANWRRHTTPAEE